MDGRELVINHVDDVMLMLLVWTLDVALFVPLSVC